MSTKIHSSSPASAIVSARLSATVDDPETEAYRRGREEGIVWAHDYATAEELRNLVADSGPCRDGRFDVGHSLFDFMRDRKRMNAVNVADYDNPFWRGFAAGAEEVLDTSARD